MASSESSDKERHESDLYVRPGWVDAAVALDQLEQVSDACGVRRAALAAAESGVTDDLGPDLIAVWWAMCRVTLALVGPPG
jgi:hypothetical protein